MNAKNELLKIVGNLKIICAEIIFNQNDDIREDIYLPLNYTEDNYTQFLERINKEYDEGWGGQQLFGTIWLENGKWIERGEYDGSEWWELKEYPAIPIYLNESL